MCALRRKARSRLAHGACSAPVEAIACRYQPVRSSFSETLAWIHRLVGRLSWSWSDRSCGVPVGAFWVKVRVWMGSLRLVGPVEAIASVVVGEFGQAEAGVRPRSVSWAPAVRLGECWQGAEVLEDCEKRGFPGPACGHPECHCAGGAGDPAGDGEQPAA